MANACNILAAGAEFHGHHTLGNQFAGHGANDVHAQNFVCFGIGQHLHHAGRIAQRAGAAIGQEREGARLVGHAICLELLLGAANPGNSGLV